jgi:hypothetical protein
MNESWCAYFRPGGEDLQELAVSTPEKPNFAGVATIT